MVQKVSWYLSLSIDPDVQRIFLEHDPVHCSIDGQNPSLHDLHKLEQLINQSQDGLCLTFVMCDYLFKNGPFPASFRLFPICFKKT